MSGIKEFVKEYPIADIKPHPNNPRIHPDSAIEKLQRSIQEFGFVNPVLISKDGILLAGHARIKASKSQKLEHVPALILDLEGAKADAYLIADNKLQEETEWDLPVLKDLLGELDTGEFPLEITGFELPEIEDLITSFEDLDEPGEAVDDGFDIDKKLDDIDEPVTQKGDIWILGDHRLMCGDSTDIENLEKLMQGETADMVFTDPPWNVNYGAVKEGNAQGYKPRRIENDHMSTEDFNNFLDAVFAGVNAITKPGCMIYVVMSAQEWGNIMMAMHEADFHWSSTIIWYKDSMVLSRKDYHTRYEPIWYGWKNGAPRLCPLEDRKQTDVWEFDRPKVSIEHPTMKPIPLVAHAINNSSKKGDVVVDVFGGSGSTLMAAQQTKRRCRTIELDPKYCDVIIRRWEEYTGEKAVKENAEKTEVNA